MSVQAMLGSAFKPVTSSAIVALPVATAPLLTPAIAQNLTTQNLPDPHSGQDNPHVSVDHIVPNTFKTRLQQTMEIPKAVWNGLRGDPDFTFSDAMRLGRIPYYSLGFALTLTALGGGLGRLAHAVTPLKLAMSTALYATGVAASNRLVNAMYRTRYGVDLDMKYQRYNGRIENVFDSHDFLRVDLLKEQHYQALRNKLGVPADINDPKRAVDDYLRQMVATSRVTKIVLGNVLAAVGAGYIARSDQWALALDLPTQLGHVWFDFKQSKNIKQLLQQSYSISRSVFGAILEDTLGWAKTSSPAKLVAGLLLGTTVIWAVSQSLFGVVRPTQFVSQKRQWQRELDAQPATIAGGAK